MTNSMNFLPVPEVKYQKKSAILGEFQVSVHSSLMNARLNEAYTSLQKRVALPGFRAGKVPMELVRKKYKEDVLQDVFQKLVNETYRKGASEHKVPVAADPYITKTNFNEWQDGKNLEYTAEVDLIPEVEVKKYKGLPVNKKDSKIKDDDVEIVLKNLLDPKAELVNLDAGSKIKKGLLAVIDFEGKLDGKVLPDASAKNFFLEVGTNNSLEEFQNGLEGMKAGEQKTIEVKYPEDYKNLEVAGKAIQYDVNVLEVKQKNYPELTDELAKEFQADNAADLKKRIRQSLEDELAVEQKQQVQEEVLLAFLESNPCEVPPSLVSRQLQHILGEVAQLLKRQRFSEQVMQEYFAKHIKDFNARAEREVKLALLLPKVIEEAKVTAEEADYKAHFEEVSKSSGQEVSAIEKFFSENKARRDELGKEIERRKALQLMVDNAKVK